MLPAASPFLISLLIAGTLMASTPPRDEDSTVFPPRHVRVPRATVSQEAAPVPSVSTSKDSLAQIAQIYPASYLTIAFGDTDHDGKNEAILLWNDQYRILEEQGNNTYTEEYVGPFLIPYAIGDLDEDGRSEIIGQRGGKIQVYESLDATSYPTQLIWSSPTFGNVVGYTAIGDTDRDGRMEIIHSINNLFGSSSLVIYESTGDNSFAQVYLAPVGSQNDSEKVIADLDGDGFTEIAFCGELGQLHIFESPADNTWVQTFTTYVGVYNAYGVVGGVDTDGNGKPELFIMGDDGSGDNFATTVVYEATGDSQFAKVATFRTPGGGYLNALGNLDGFGRDEYLMATGNQLFIYRAVAPSEWAMVGSYQVSDPDHVMMQTFDVNQNGRDEVFWETDASQFFQTLVLEYPDATLSGVVGNPGIRPVSLSVSPNPCRAQATLLVSTPNIVPGRLTVFDAAGHIVGRQPLTSRRNGQALWSVQGLSAGVYFLRLEDRDGILVASGRGIVIK